MQEAGAPLGWVLFDVETGRAERIFDARLPVSSVAISRDNRYALSGSTFSEKFSPDTSTLILWNVNTGQNEKNFMGYNNPVTSVAFSSDSRFVLSGSSNGSITLWEIKTGQKLITMISNTEGEWLIYTDDGYWDGSPESNDLVAMVRGLDVYSVDQFAVRNNRA